MSGCMRATIGANEEMSELIVLMGIPGSGKSTWVTEYFREHSGALSTVVVSPDAIRKELTGNINNQDRNPEVFATAHKRAEAIQWEWVKRIIFDATSVRQDSRWELITIARHAGAKTRLVVFDRISAFQWNRERERVVPTNVMNKMQARFDHSLTQIGTEDWDVIEFVRD